MKQKIRILVITFVFIVSIGFIFASVPLQIKQLEKAGYTKSETAKNVVIKENEDGLQITMFVNMNPFRRSVSINNLKNTDPEYLSTHVEKKTFSTDYLVFSGEPIFCEIDSEELKIISKTEKCTNLSEKLEKSKPEIKQMIEFYQNEQ